MHSGLPQSRPIQVLLLSLPSLQLLLAVHGQGPCVPSQRINASRCSQDFPPEDASLGDVKGDSAAGDREEGLVWSLLGIHLHHINAQHALA